MNKIYIDGNYLFLELSGAAILLADFKNRVAIIPINSTKTRFLITSPLIGRHEIELENIVDFNGNLFSADSWENFYENSTGDDNDGDPMSFDAFGRQRTSGTGQRFDVEFIYGKQPEIVDESINGGGTATHDANSRDIVLANGGTAVGDNAALYSYDVPYTPGNSQMVDATGTLDAAAIGGGTAQIYFRSNVSGSVVETVYDQSKWNQNTVPDVDFSKSQIFMMDFQSLKVGTIRFALNRSGGAVLVHEIDNDNIRATGYWQLPSLPVHWRVYNDASFSYMEIGYGDANNAIGFRYKIAVNAAASMRAICATVKSEGGKDLFDIPGYNRYKDNLNTAKTVSTTLIPILSIRARSTFKSIDFRGLIIPTGVGVHTDQPIRYVILQNATLTGASWADVDTNFSAAEYDVSATVVSGGIVIDGDYLDAGKNVETFGDATLGRAILSQGRNGSIGTLTIAAIKTDTTNASVKSHFKWSEIR
jgi:hypothetical protein